MKQILLLSVIILLANILSAQNISSIEIDTLQSVTKRNTTISNPYSFNYKQIVIPTLFMGTALVGLKNNWLEYQNIIRFLSPVLNCRK